MENLGKSGDAAIELAWGGAGSYYFIMISCIITGSTESLLPHYKEIESGGEEGDIVGIMFTKSDGPLSIFSA